MTRGLKIPYSLGTWFSCASQGRGHAWEFYKQDGHGGEELALLMVDLLSPMEERQLSCFDASKGVTTEGWMPSMPFGNEVHHQL
jgi:hypothetical protein